MSIHLRIFLFEIILNYLIDEKFFLKTVDNGHSYAISLYPILLRHATQPPQNGTTLVKVQTY